MRKQQVQILEDITRIQKKQGLLLEKAKNAQQQIFQLFAHRHLLSQKLIHKHTEEVIDYLPGSFGYAALNAVYLAVCLEMRVELNPDDHSLLKRLVEWSDNYPSLKKNHSVSLMEAVLPENSTQPFQSYEFYMTFLNFIGADIVKLIRGSKDESDKADKLALSSLTPEDLISFLLNSLPKVLYNIILPNDVLPPEQKRTHQSLQILFRAASLEYFMRSRTYYATLMKILVKMLVKLELKPGQQKQMMEIVFRYFYAYHFDKKYGATEIFIEAYNGLGESVRFAMADEFVLFCKIIRKVGKGKFLDFLLAKSAWLRDINTRVADNNYVGYAKQTLNPFPYLRVPDIITVPNGKTQHRTFQILQDYSLFYFNIEIPSRDITLRLHYLGDITDPKPSYTELLSYEKRSGTIKANIMAAKRGIYQFQFDNTYSWINSKTIKFELMILAPVEFQGSEEPKWIRNYYDNIPINELSDKSKLIVIKRSLPPKPDIQYDGVANITKAGSFYNLKLGKGSNMYEFETESEDYLVKKITELLETNGNIKWMLNGEQLDEPNDLKGILGKGIDKEKKEKTEAAEDVSSNIKQQESLKTHSQGPKEQVLKENTTQQKSNPTQVTSQTQEKTTNSIGNL